MLKKYLQTFQNVVSGVVITDNNENEISITDALTRIKQQFDILKKNGNSIYLIGNGGSSGIVSHASVDLLNSCNIKAFPLTDNSQITCFANDYGYENVFSKQLETLLTTGDILITVSSSGKSNNIINAAATASQKEIFLITLSGFSEDNTLRKSGDINLWSDSGTYGIVEIGHAFLLHFITDFYSENSLLV